MQRSLFLTLGVLFFIHYAYSQQEKILVSASDSAIYFSGRVDTGSPQFVRYDWPGVGIHFCFTGKKAGIKIKGGERNYFNLFVDGQFTEVLHSPGDTIFWVDKLRGSGPHEVSLIKRTEGDMGQVLFYGLLLESNGRLLPYPHKPGRCMEFIGNSITCGYGTEGTSKSERFKPETENNYKAYGAILTRAFNAEGRYIAHSGLGVVRNYGDKQKISTKLKPMPARFNKVLDTDSALVWDFTRWQPHLVVINLGTNDFSTQPHPDKAVFQRGYENLILDVRAAYGNIPVFCVVGPMLKDPTFEYVKEVVDIMRSLHSDNQVLFVGFPDGLINNSSDLGSDWHPSYEGQKKMAGHLLFPIATILNWDFNPGEIFPTHKGK